jgi:hypothetical protein
MEHEPINVISSVKREIERQKMSKAELARRLHLNHTSVLTMFRRPTLHVHRLIQLSEILQYNFFRDVADQLPYQEPAFKTQGGDRSLEEENIELKDRVKYLEMEVSILRQTIKDIAAGRGQ